MNWDRWHDASWVRWHKMLPEKQSGWAYQPLAIANQAPELYPGTPVLLLHFDGTGGQTTTADSSPVGNLMTLNSANAGVELTTSNPKFGTASFQVPDDNFYQSYALYTPIAAAAPLDIFTQPSWTIQGWIMATGTVDPGYALIFCAWGTGIIPNVAAGSPLTVTLLPNGDDATAQLKVIDNGIFATGHTMEANVSLTYNTWHHLAVVNVEGVTTLYFDGVAVQGPFTGWNPTAYAGSGYSAGQGGNTGVTFGSWVNVSGGLSSGQYDEISAYPVGLYTSNFTPPTAPSALGLPNIFNTALPPSGTIPITYVGLCRDLHDWSSIDGQFWIALGTHLKLYVVNNATLYDITPAANTSNVSAALATVSGSNQVTITDLNNNASTGNFITLLGTQAVGGLPSIDGEYQISVINPTTYTITVAETATSTAAGGGMFTITYDLGPGLPSNGELLGYGTGEYGEGTYGTPRAYGTGVPARLRTWSLDNYGQDLIASESDGEIYWWQRDLGPSSPAAIIPAAPTGCQRVIVDALQESIVACGCTDATGTFNAMLVRWCTIGDITDWYPTTINTAGGLPLTAGSRIITALKTKGQNLIFTDTDLYAMQYVGSPDIYDFYPAGRVTIVGPNAAVDVDGVAYFMGFDNIYNYSGTLNLQACDVWETVYDPNVSTSLLKTQSEKVVCYTYEPKTEITWLYPSIGGVSSINFTAGIAQGATSGTLTTPWSAETGIYHVTFSDGECMPTTLTQGATSATWQLPMNLPVLAAAQVGGDNDRYVTYNWEDGDWYYGAWFRTCAMGRAPAMGGYPYGVNGGYLYQHETGTDAVEAWGTQAIGFYMKSLDITVGGAKSEYTMGGSDARFAVGGSDAHLLMRSLIPDWAYMTGAMNLTVLTKDRPQDPNYVVDGPVAFSEGTDQIDIDAHGSQLVLQFDNYTNAGAPSLGSSFRMGILQGLAVPYAKR